ncbi:MAG: hypothetical protein LBU36_00510 [Clostridiales bacterium]|jgi:hypothetical protein|nr:hypothetical protein [Clostridiales bacterium]
MKFKKFISALVISAAVLCSGSSVLASDEASPSVGTAPRSEAVHWDSDSVTGPFNHDFTVSDSTNKYGKVFYSNLGNAKATITIKKKGGTSNIVDFTVSPKASDGAATNGGAKFNVEYNTTYTISIINDGSEKLNGLISLKTSDAQFAN